MFLTIEDLLTHLDLELIENISDHDRAIPQAAIEAAIAEASGYLGNYDTAVLFNTASKDPALLMYVKDIAVWHFLVLSNTLQQTDFREKRYTNAVKWLSSIQAGKVAPPWPKAAPVAVNTPIYFASNPKRSHHF